jgi:uncharacterized SAM-binding protein YcdF (DUF218 family)
MATLLCLRVHPFLAVTERVPAKVLVVEGWGSVFTLEHALEEFRTNDYERVFVTGGPIEQGAPLSEYKTYAELGAATLIKLGLDSNTVIAVPAPRVAQDRTYIAAFMLRQWWAEHRFNASAINLVTDGTHARRSWLLFGEVFEPETAVGIIAIPPRDYDARRWWGSSGGFRAVIGESLAYFYARFIFSPPETPVKASP